MRLKAEPTLPACLTECGRKEPLLNYQEADYCKRYGWLAKNSTRLSSWRHQSATTTVRGFLNSVTRLSVHALVGVPPWQRCRGTNWQDGRHNNSSLNRICKCDLCNLHMGSHAAGIMLISRKITNCYDQWSVIQSTAWMDHWSAPCWQLLARSLDTMLQTQICTNNDSILTILTIFNPDPWALLGWLVWEKWYLSLYPT